MPSPDQAPAILASPRDPGLQPVRRLLTREGREEAGLFFIEGVRFVLQAVEQGVEIDRLIVVPRLLHHPHGKKLVADLERGGTAVLRLTPNAYASLKFSRKPKGLAALVRQGWQPLAEADPQAGLCWIALHQVRSPGNLGTIIRSADAVGAAGLILVGHHVEPYDPATVRASMGAMFTQRFVRAGFKAFAAWKDEREVTVIGTSPDATTDYADVRYPERLVLFMGDERKGLPKDHQRLCDQLVTIPMVGRADSLNLGVATSVLLYEVFNQRRHAVNVTTKTPVHQDD